VHLRTTNPIESTFATVRHRNKITKAPGSRAAGLAMAFKLVESAQARWRGERTPPRRLVRAGARFENGKLAERPGGQAPPTAAWKIKRRLSIIRPYPRRARVYRPFIDKA
jgi:hypothetical protein